MKLGYFYLHNNTPVIATEEKPDETSFYYQANGTHLVHAEYYEAMEDWERQLIPAENVELWNDEDPDYIARIDLPINPDNILIIYPGSKIEYEGNVIHKIIQT